MPIQPTSSDPKDLIKSIKSGVPCPNLVYIFGTDRVRKQRALDALFGLVFGAESSSAITKINASELDQQKLQIFEDARNSLSLFSSKRMFVVDGAEELPDKAAQSLASSLKTTVADIYCIFLARTAPAGHAVVKLAKKQGSIFQFIPLEGLELSKWIEKEFKAQGIVEYPKSLPSLLANLGSQDLDVISGYISMLGLYSNDGKLEAEDLKSLFRESSESNDFAFLDALLASNTSRLPVLLHQSLLSGKSPFALLGLLQRSFLTYLSVSALAQTGASVEQVAATLKLQPWLARKHLEIVRRVPQNRLKSIVKELVRVDSLLKNRSLGTESVFESLYNI